MQSDLNSLECCGGGGALSAVHYSRQVMDEILTSAMEKFLSIPRGGVEIGGVLFGAFRDSEVFVLAHEPVQIDYATGPSFVLCEDDEVRFVEGLETSLTHPEFGHLEPVGWYHSHTRSGVCLSEEDVRVHDRFFSRVEQIAIVVKPFKFEPAQFGIFARDETGVLKGDVPVAAFAVGPVRQKENDPDAKGNPIVDSLEEPVSPSLAGPRRSRTRAYVIAGLILAWTTAAIAVYTWPSASSSTGPPASLGLQLTEQANQLAITWDRESPAVARAESGLLKIRDGSEELPPIRLDRVFLSRGTLAYARRSGDVQVTMRVVSPRHEAVEEVSRFIGAPPALPIELPVLKADRPPVQPENRNSEGERSRLTPPATRFTPPSAGRMDKAVASPRFVEPAQTVISATAGPITLPGGPPVTLAPPPPTPVKAAAAASGRAIWTGRLPKGGLLLIDSRRPSAGSITGQLPQRPARMRVYPADLADAGIVVYTPDKPRAGVEAPSAANGWNLTTYTTDPKRSKEITLLENDGRKLLIRSEDRTITMLVIQWEELSH